MVRTKADCSGSAAGRKVVAARAPRKNVGSSSSSSAGTSSSSGVGASPSASKYAGGNPVCPRPTPDWQKGIGNFFTKPNKENREPTEAEEGGGCSSAASESSSSQSQPGGSGTSSSPGPSSSKAKSNRPNRILDSDDEDDS